MAAAPLAQRHAKFIAAGRALLGTHISAMARAPHSEIPIYVDSLVRGEEVRVGTVGGAAKERIPVDHREVWAQLDEIPEVPPVGGVGAVVRRRTGLALTAVVGNPYRFRAGEDDASILNIMPRGFVAYHPTLRSAAGVVVPYDPSVWVADGVRNLIEFLHKTPAELGHTPPFTIDCWVYTGVLGYSPTRWFAFEQRDAGTPSHGIGATWAAGTPVRRQLTDLIGVGPQRNSIALADNILTFSPGTYRIAAKCPAYSPSASEFIGPHRIILANAAGEMVAGGATAFDGVTTANGGRGVTSFATAEGIFTTSIPLDIQILHTRSGSGVVLNGFGKEEDLGYPEIYTTVSIELL